MDINDFSREEFNKIFSWLPYRSDWPVDRNEAEDNVEGYFGPLMNEINSNEVFTTLQTQDGGLSNYLEFICYPSKADEYTGAALVLCISLCAPIAAYGPIKSFRKAVSSYGWSFIEPEDVGVVTIEEIKPIEAEFIRLLKKYSLVIMDRDFASRKLPEDLPNIGTENLNWGDRYLHGIFQCTD